MAAASIFSADCDDHMILLSQYIHVADYKNIAYIEEPTTVRRPETAMERLLMAPSISPISSALAVPMAGDVYKRQCHMWDSGYDIVNRLDGVLEEFDHIIGLKYLKAFHINDSINGRGSHKDRHTLLGRGCMGENAVLRLSLIHI